MAVGSTIRGEGCGAQGWKGRGGEGKEVGWSRLGDRRHHLSQQTNNVCRRDNKVVAAQQQSGFQADRRLDEKGAGRWGGGGYGGGSSGGDGGVSRKQS